MPTNVIACGSKDKEKKNQMQASLDVFGCNKKQQKIAPIKLLLRRPRNHLTTAHLRALEHCWALQIR